MTTNEQNGHLVASRIEVEPTDRQRAAHKLVEAFGIAGEIDWTAVEANFRVLTETAGYESPRHRDGKSGGGQSQLVPTCRTGTLFRQTSTPFASHWSKRGALSRLSWWTASPHATGRAGLSRTGFRGTVSRCSRGTEVVGKSRLALQLAWSLSGEGRWLGEGSADAGERSRLRIGL